MPPDQYLHLPLIALIVAIAIGGGLAHAKHARAESLVEGYAGSALLAAFVVAVTLNITAQHEVISPQGMALIWSGSFSMALMVAGFMGNRMLLAGAAAMLIATGLAARMDEVLLSKIRLAIVGQLVSSKWVSFSELQRNIDATNGNLSARLAKLVDVGYVNEEKRFEGRRPQSRYSLTKTGRGALLSHVAALQALLNSGRS